MWCFFSLLPRVTLQVCGLIPNDMDTSFEPEIKGYKMQVKIVPAMDVGQI